MIIKKAIALIQVRDDEGLDQYGNSGDDEKWSHAGYVSKGRANCIP